VLAVTMVEVVAVMAEAVVVVAFVMQIAFL
jgi:hypothetical protein